MHSNLLNLKLLIKIFVGLMLLLAILVSTAFLVPVFYKNQIKKEVLDLVNSNLNAEVTMSDFDISIWRSFPDFTITLHHLNVNGLGEFAGDTLLTVSKMSVSMDVLKYFKEHEIHILHAEMLSPIINVKVDKVGHANYDIVKTSADTSTKDSNSYFLDIKKVIIRDGKINYHDAQQKIKLEIDGLEHIAKWELNKTIFDWETHTKMNSFTCDYNGVKYLNKKETELDLIVEIDTDKSFFTFKENNIRINHFQFGIVGNVSMQKNEYNLDLKFNTTKTKFKHLFSLLPGIYMNDLEQIKTDGEAAFDGFVKGKYGKEHLPAYHLNLKVQDAMFKYDSLPFPVENINFHLVADNKDGILHNTKIDLKSFQLTMDDNVVRGHMKMDGLENSYIKGEIKALVDLADLSKFYPVKDIEIAGIVNVDVKADGIYNKLNKSFPTIDASFGLSDGFVQTKDFPEPLKEIHFIAEVKNATGKTSDTKAEISKCSFLLDDKTFTMLGTVVNFETYEYDVEMQGKIDLAKLTKIFTVEGLDLQGMVEVDLESKGRMSDLEQKDYRFISAKGRVEVTGFKADGMLLKQEVQIKEALFNFSPDKISLEKLEGQLGNGQIKIKGDLAHYMSLFTDSDDHLIGDLELQCDTLNLNKWLVSQPSKNQNDTTNQLNIIDLPSNIDFTFDSDIKNLYYDDMHITDLEGEINLKDKVLSVKETGFNTLGAKFNLSGNYNTTEIVPAFDFNVNIQELDINKAYNEVALVRNYVPLAKEAFGTLSLDYALKSKLDNHMQPIFESMNGGGRIRIHEAKLEGMKIMNEISRQSKKSKLKDPTLKDFVMDTEIHGTKLIVKPFTIKFSDFDIEVNGVSELNSKIDYVLKVSMLPFERIRLPFHVTGTYDKYKIALGKGKPIE